MALKNRVSLTLKEKPRTVFAYDFSSVIVSDGIIKIDTGVDVKEYRYEDIEDHLTIWPRSNVCD